MRLREPLKSLWITALIFAGWLLLVAWYTRSESCRGLCPKDRKCMDRCFDRGYCPSR